MPNSGTTQASIKQELALIYMDMSFLSSKYMPLDDRIIHLIMLADMAPKKRLSDVSDNLAEIQKSFSCLLQEMLESGFRIARLVEIAE